MHCQIALLDSVYAVRTIGYDARISPVYGFIGDCFGKVNREEDRVVSWFLMVMWCFEQYCVIQVSLRASY